MNFFEIITGSTRLLEALIKLAEHGKTLHERVAPWFRRARPVAPPMPTDYTNEFMQSVVDIRDVRGSKAVLEKRQRIAVGTAEQAIVRDGLWGNGDQLASYRVQGARKIGIKHEGLRTTVLLSVEPRPKHGEPHDIVMKRTIRDTYVDEVGYFDLMPERPTGYISLKVLFPRKRPPHEAHVVEWPSERLLKHVPVRYTAGRRPFLKWKLEKPQPLLAYSLRWAW